MVLDANIDNPVMDLERARQKNKNICEYLVNSTCVQMSDERTAEATLELDYQYYAGFGRDAKLSLASMSTATSGREDLLLNFLPLPPPPAPPPIHGECKGVMCPDPAVLPVSISNALTARAVEREREQPRKT